MGDPVLHYVHDPLCGWCYAAEPLVAAAAGAGIPVVLHGGGLWEGPTHAFDAKRRMMRATDGRIAALTGQPFGPAYLDGLLDDPATVWWSRPTVAAILAAERLRADGGRSMLTAIGHAHYVDGRRVVEDGVLADLAAAIGLPRAAFAASLDAVAADRHIADTRALMRRHALGGFPGFLLERDGVLGRLPHEGLYGRPAGFVDAIRAAAAPPPTPIGDHVTSRSEG